MTITYVGGNQQASTLADLIKGFNSILANSRATDLAQAKLDASAAEAMQNRINSNRENQRGLAEILNKHREIGIQRDTENRLGDLQSKRNIIFDRYNSGGAASADLGKVGNRVAHPSQMDLLALAGLEGQSANFTPIPQQFANVDLKQAQAMDYRSQAAKRAWDMDNPDPSKIDPYAAWSKSPSGMYWSKRSPGTNWRDLLGEEDFNAYDIYSNRMLQEGQNPVEYGDWQHERDIKEQAASAGVGWQNIPDHVIDQSKAMKDLYSAAEREIAVSDRLIQLIQTPGFQAGGPAALVNAVTALQNAAVNFGYGALVPEKVRAALDEMGEYDAGIREFAVQVAGVLKPVSDADMKLVLEMVGGRGNTKQGLARILTARREKAANDARKAMDWDQKFDTSLQRMKTEGQDAWNWTMTTGAVDPGPTPTVQFPEDKARIIQQYESAATRKQRNEATGETRYLINGQWVTVKD